VAPETLLRVRQAIEETGYVPNLVAGSLAANRTGVIAAIVPTIGNPVFSETIEAMGDAFREDGLHLLLGNSGDDEQEMHALVSTFLARRPDGLFIHGGNYDPQTETMLRRAAVPTVESGDLSRASNPIDMVVAYSNRAAGWAMTEYLIRRGYRRIGFVSRDIHRNDRMLERQAGYAAALEAAGLSHRSELVITRNLTFADGAEALKLLREREPRLDAIFFGGDVWAAGALYECQRQGLVVPRDIAIAGFDDGAIAAQTVPTLTTVRVKRGEIGRRVAELLLARIKNQPIASKIVDVGFQIISRESA
jgi:LacI family gluconate utilization system Gnt-I transcriptional repressor